VTAFRAFQDNVLLELEPLPAQTEGGLVIPDMGKGDSRRKATAVRWAKVLAVGPGHRPGCRHCGGQRQAFIPTQVRVGDRVLIDAMAGQDYLFDISAPRHHAKAMAFDGVAGYRGELRVVREDEVIAVDDAYRALATAPVKPGEDSGRR
jgi:co-chaperonin GroES (HSP10)